tara:strand:+ start:173 stop:349 length:177 start_codon:yes stop_codon:yes gene_type:complete
MNKFIEWQINNKIHIKNIFDIIINDLDKYDLIIYNKKKLYEETVLYLYQSTIHIKYIN